MPEPWSSRTTTGQSSKGMGRAFVDLGVTSFEGATISSNGGTGKGKGRETAGLQTGSRSDVKPWTGENSDDELLLSDDAHTYGSTPRPLSKSMEPNVAKLAGSKHGVPTHGLEYDPKYPPKFYLKNMHFKKTKNQQVQLEVASQKNIEESPVSDGNNASMPTALKSASSSSNTTGTSSNATATKAADPRPRPRLAYKGNSSPVRAQKDHNLRSRSKPGRQDLKEAIEEGLKQSPSTEETSATATKEKKETRKARKPKNCPIDELLEEGSTKTTPKPSKAAKTPKKQLLSKAQDFPFPSPLSSPHRKKRANSPKGSCPLDDPMFQDRPPTSSQTFTGDEQSSDSDEADLEPTAKRRTRSRAVAPFPMQTQELESLRRKPGSSSSSSGSSKRSSAVADTEERRGRKKARNSEKVSDLLNEMEHWEDVDITLQADDIDVDPNALCPYCDELLPASPTKLLTSMYARIRSKSWSQPRPGNRLGLKAPLTIFVDVCQRHRFETHQLPQAEENRWPTHIDFDALPGRVRQLRLKLEEVWKDKKSSHFWQEFDEDLKSGTAARWLMGVQGQWQAFTKSLPGYYGEQGAVIILQTLNDMFPHSSIDPTLTSPMRPGEFIQHILVPEVALALIQEDMDIETKEAIETMRDSSEYGTAMFPDLNKEDTVGDKIMRERARVRRQEIKREEQQELEKEGICNLCDSNMDENPEKMKMDGAWDTGMRRASQPRKAKTEAMKNLQEDDTSAAELSDSATYAANKSPPVGTKGKCKNKAPQMQVERIKTPRQIRLGISSSVVISSSDEEDTPKPVKARPKKKSVEVAPSKQREKAIVPTRPVGKGGLSSNAHPLALARARTHKQDKGTDGWKLNMRSSVEDDEASSTKSTDLSDIEIALGFTSGRRSDKRNESSGTSKNFKWLLSSQ